MTLDHENRLESRKALMGLSTVTLGRGFDRSTAAGGFLFVAPAFYGSC